MSEYPKRLELLPQDEKWRGFFDHMYVEERKKLGLLPDPDYPQCLHCVKNQ